MRAVVNALQKQNLLTDTALNVVQNVADSVPKDLLA